MVEKKWGRIVFCGRYSSRINACWLSVRLTHLLVSLQVWRTSKVFVPIYSSWDLTGTGGVVGPHYASSKSALHGLLHWIAQRYAKDGIVSTVLPVHHTPRLTDLRPATSLPRHLLSVSILLTRNEPASHRRADTGMIPQNREDFAVSIFSRVLWTHLL
jgi:NAD(P)-dependent dehydrogenase (short-subunit alcohol dehydrogenase family)